MEQIQFVDVYKIFSNEGIIGSLKGAGIKYRTPSLHNISMANLGRGKLNDINGIEAAELEFTDIQKEYCVEDCNLTLDNCSKNNWELLKILKTISELVGLDFISARCSRY